MFGKGGEDRVVIYFGRVGLDMRTQTGLGSRAGGRAPGKKGLGFV